jgi:hypothetical protein
MAMKLNPAQPAGATLVDEWDIGATDDRPNPIHGAPGSLTHSKQG